MEKKSNIENPLVTAKEMTDALHDNTEALTGLKNRYRNVVIALMVVLLVFGYTVKVKHDGDVLSCSRGNELREQIDAKFESISALLEAATPPEKMTNSAKEFFALLDTEFPRRNCGEVGWL